MQQKRDELGQIIGLESDGPVTVDMIGTSDVLIDGDGEQYLVGPKRKKAGRPFSIAIRMADPPADLKGGSQEPS